jgi:DNA-binding NtrC family response regulator
MTARQSIAVLGPAATTVAAPLALVVDDEPAIRRLIRRWLEHWGCRVREATSAPEAYAMMQDEPASVVFCDLNMRGESGMWLIQQVKGNWPATAVAVITGVNDVQTVLHCKQAGAFDYLVKPFRREMLYRALRRAEHMPTEEPTSLGLLRVSPMTDGVQMLSQAIENDRCSTIGHD